MLPARLRHRILAGFAVCLVVVSAYHAAAIVWRDIHPSSSPLRHGLFVVIDLGMAVGLWLRPKGIFWVFAALSIQQLHSHGHRLWRVWSLEHQVDWASVLVVTAVPWVCYLLYEKPQS
jgi:hypothetical protein